MQKTAESLTVQAAAVLCEYKVKESEAGGVKYEGFVHSLSFWAERDGVCKLATSMFPANRPSSDQGRQFDP